MAPDDLYARALANAEAGSRSVDIGEPWQIGVYVVPFLAFALLSYRLYYARSLRPGAFLAWLLPREVWITRSSWVDLQVFVAGRLLFPVLSAAGITATAVVASSVSRGLASVATSPALSDGGWAVAVGFTLIVAMLYDLSTFASHLLMHRVPWLWEFHKVHHSAEVLTPLTAFRRHPVYELMGRAFDVLLVGPFLGLVFFLFAGPVDALTAFGVNVVFAAFAVLGSGLRHSHMWLSFGPVLSRIFVSPAQHQIHHSTDPRHWDTNYGEVFAIWDLAFGTLYVPREREELTFGIDEPQAHTSVFRAWLVPFGRVLRRLVGAARVREVSGDRA